MYMEKQDIDQLVIAFLNHSISEEDAECLFMWVNEKEENKQYLLSYQKVNLATTFRKQSKYSSNQAYLQFLKRQKNMQTQVFVHRLRSFMKYAAVLFICAFIGFNFYNYLGTNVHKAEEFIVCVPNSKHSFFYLSDSTEVWLNSGSEFKYTSDYGTKNREVYLKGEAYFNVRKNQQLPFLVKTDSVSVRVYGTKFSIRNYSDMETVKIALQEGQIALNLESENDQLFVKPEEEIIYRKGQSGYSKKHIDIHNVADWRNGILRFDMEPLSDIVQTLKRQYNVDIQMESTTYNQKVFYGSFSINQSISEILDIVSASLDLQYVYRDNVYCVYFKK